VKQSPRECFTAFFWPHHLLLSLLILPLPLLVLVANALQLVLCRTLFVIVEKERGLRMDVGLVSIHAHTELLCVHARDVGSACFPG